MIILNVTTERLLRVTSRVTPVTLRAIQGYAKTYHKLLRVTLRAITITSMATTGYIHRVMWLNRMVFIVTRLLELIKSI